jgi:4'-phosphopantetheinyl transferase
MQLAAPLVWLVDGRLVSDTVLARCASWFSAGEQQRYAAFQRPLRQRQFLIGRILLRQALASLLGTRPEELVLSERTGQAPLFERAGCEGMGYSISHSGPWIACAASTGSALGLDIEVLDPERDLHALAAQAFDPEELAWWKGRHGASQRRDFYELWCAKEARFKMPATQGNCIPLFHPELAIALCSAQTLRQMPALTLRSL